MSAAALRALHVPGDPLVLPNAWDAGTARLVERRRLPGRRDDAAAASPTRSATRTASRRRPTRCSRPSRASRAPSTCRSPPTWRPATGSTGASSRERVVGGRRGRASTSRTPTTRNHPALVPVDEQASADRARQGGAPTSCSTRASTSTSAAAAPTDALERARALPRRRRRLRVSDRRRRRGHDRRVRRARRSPVNILLRPGAPPVARLAELGVARISLGHFLHAEMMDALRARLNELSPRRAG